MVTQNTVLLVQLLYKMCQVKIVFKSDTEVSLIKETQPFAFSHLQKYLAHVNVDTLCEFSALVEQIINASDGVSSAEKDAKDKFENYIKERKNT